jgi:hypothetical protein
MGALHKHLEVAGGLFKKHGLGVLGFWTEEIGTAFQVNYMWVYENIEERQKKLAAFGSDSAWRKQVTEETEKYGVVVARTHNIMLTPTPYCSEVRMTGNVQELRIYDAMPGKLPELHNRFANHLMKLFKKHGMGNIGYWTETFGTSNRLVYMLGYPSLGDREKSWAAFDADPERQRTFAAGEKSGALVARISNRVLRPTAYSPRE